MQRLTHLVIILGATVAIAFSAGSPARAAQRPRHHASPTPSRPLSALRLSSGGQDAARRIRLYSIDCPTTDTCYAAGELDTGLPVTSSSGIVVPIRNGTVEEPRVLSGTDWVNAVACPAVDTCYLLGSSGGGDVLVTMAGGVPGTPQAIDAGPGPWGLGCTPGGELCYAVGTTGHDRGSTGLVVPITAGRIGQRESIAGTSQLSDVACPTDTSCYAVGAADSAGTLLGTIVALTGGTASASQTVPSVPGLKSIVCPGADTCYTVGDGFPNGDVVFVLTDGSVTSSQPLSPAANLTALGCVDGETCFGLGKILPPPAGDSPATGQLAVVFPAVLTLTSGAVSNVQAIPAAVSGWILADVACPTSTTCYAVGGGGQGNLDPSGVVLPIAGGVVGTPQLVPAVED